MTYESAGNQSAEQHSPCRESAPGEVTVVLSVAGLAENVYFAGGCCAVAATDAIRDEINSWPFVQHVAIDERANEITLSMTETDADVEAIVEVVESMGFPVTDRVARQTSPRTTPQPMQRDSRGSDASL